MRVCFVSGAPWNATDTAQRYQQLVLAMRKLSIEADFYCPYGNYSATDCPYEADENKVYDFFIVGMPEKLTWQRQWKFKTLVCDICDAWDGEMVEGVDFKDEFYRLIKEADFIVSVSPTLSIKAQQIAPGKPTFRIPNGVRQEVFHWQPKYSDKPMVVFWAAAYKGQNWWDLETAFALPDLFPDIEFKYYFATDRSFSTHRQNLTVKTALRGVPFSIILDELTLPAIGILPWRPNDEVTWCADALKIYEYGVLGLTIVAVNCLVTEEIRDQFVAFGNTKELFPKLLEKALRSVSVKRYEPEKFAHWSWESRAKDYIELLESFKR